MASLGLIPSDHPSTRARCHFVPPYLLERLAEAGLEPAELVAETLRRDAVFRAERAVLTQLPQRPHAAGMAWRVHTADGGTTLPGRVARSAGEPEVGDEAVDEAAYGVSASLDLFDQVYGRRSFDGAGAMVSATVHYGRRYANAFWDGTQLVFGDGDGRVFGRFTKAVDVLAHEFAHAVTEHSAGLVYRGQSGALNESMSDVFAACLQQRLLGQTAEQGDWLIGADIFLPGVAARGLRDMREPGTAYDDPALGKDPQPGHMRDYIHTTDDNGGVHLNSGIPNRAFHLAAVGIGGSSAEGAGRIWYSALTGPELRRGADFAEFAALTVQHAGEHAAVVQEAWREVGVLDAAGQPATPAAEAPPRDSSMVAVARTGGLLGQTVAGAIDITGDDPRAPEVRSLAQRIDLATVTGAGSEIHPDMYLYCFEVCGQGPVDVPEHELTPDLHRLAEVVIDGDGRLAT